MAFLLPPSPAFSYCDSLADIEDLDAFLAAQGPLSSFATPPMKSNPQNETMEPTPPKTDESPIMTADGSELDHHHISTTLSAAAGTGKYSSFYEDILIQDMLQKALLPLEVLAIAHNVLQSYNASNLSLGPGKSLNVPSDLLVLAAFVLASTYTSDSPPHSIYWSANISDNTWLPKRIDQTVMHILDVLDWRLHQLASPEAVAKAVGKLHPPRSLALPTVSLHEKAMVDVVMEDNMEWNESTKQQPLRITIDGSSACWVHGQLTPDFSPPVSAVIENGSDGSFVALV